MIKKETVLKVRVKKDKICEEKKKLSHIEAIHTHFIITFLLPLCALGDKANKN